MLPTIKPSLYCLSNTKAKKTVEVIALTYFGLLDNKIKIIPPPVEVEIESQAAPRLQGRLD